MADQPELDLPPPEPRTAVTAPPGGFAGFSRAQLVLGAVVLAIAIWAMWVTRSLASPHQDRIVSARLSSIVGDYVTAQARSAAPPAQVEAEMKTFMAGLDREIQRRSANGEVVLVGEAVLTRNVPDITDNLRRAVFASGVPMPRQASPADLPRLSQQGLATAPVMPAPTAGPVPPASMPGTFVAPQAVGQIGAPQAPAVSPSQPAAAVSSFGGPDVGGAR